MRVNPSVSINSKPVKGEPNPIMPVLMTANGHTKGRFDRQEIYNRLPELNYINDMALRHKVTEMFMEYCPAYFWTAPASYGHHQPDHREYRGLWLHTKRAFTIYEGLIDSPVEAGSISKYDADCGRAAILLHDMFKQGRSEMGAGETKKDHDKDLARFLGKETSLPRKIINCIDTHNGPWYEGKTAITGLEKLHHYADMVASRENVKHIEVLDPHYALKKQFEHLEEYSVDEL